MNAPIDIPPSSVRARLSVEQFVLLNDSGAFDGYGKSELIDGDIYVMNAQWSPHARAKSRLHVALANRLAEMGSDLEALVEVSVWLDDYNLPEPDLVITRHRGDGAVPVDSVVLVIEVSDSTLSIDAGRKADLYAAAGVPEYWVVDVNKRRVLMHRTPDDDGYLNQSVTPFGEPLISATIEGLEVGSANLLG